mmetsp:Transcript_35559/g.36243  ORF Transcript_35559/g.36243 Transcript_35559/m.36243 type:complete len:469 (-) Transcript_35559:261-1667(-)|eukprot:CAMPEP_0182422670 /NCGR_PEP_ID=MMETSP1167-20130531/8425_1 /TAXON_ID=2988 /ORGANISM="Mallomonas Sp, Strain CCMP3275" /LENGTH=468 /DNA_ID=CAMNT_0024600933 /DNA_START=60 /DNA_END=1466 /DNA_ORIENTATION=+
MSFNARDLALILPDQVGDAYSLRHTETGEVTDKYEPLKPKIDQTKKVTRYFPGKAPQWAEEENSTITEEIVGVIDRRPEGAIISAGVDKRLARLAATAEAGVNNKVGRRIYEAEIVVDDNKSDEQDNDWSLQENEILEGDAPMVMLIEKAEEDEEEIHARRSRILQKLSLKQSQEEMRKEKEKASESESEYETDTDDYSEEDEEENARMMKPVFVPKAKRQTIQDQERVQRELELRETQQLQAKEERKQKTRVLVAESLRREEERKELQAQGDGESDSESRLPDDTDDADDEEEYESWQMREMMRMRRDAQEREEVALEQADIARRRHMTQEQRDAEDRKRGEGQYRVKEKSSWRFLQKYYHRGAFYVDESSVTKSDDVRKKDFSAPTLEDKFDKEKLPKIMQVKNFGRRGRTKYTHLADQDTTRTDATRQPMEELRPIEHLRHSYMRKRSGVGDLDTAGKPKRIREM